MCCIKRSILKTLKTLWITPTEDEPEKAASVNKDTLLAALPKRYQKNVLRFYRKLRELLIQDCINFVPEIDGYIITQKGLDYLDNGWKTFWQIFSFVVSTAASSAIGILVGWLIRGC